VKSVLLPFCAWFAATVVSAQPASQIITTRSYSGQFIAREMRARPLWAPSPVAMRVPIAGSFAFLVTAPPVAPSAQPDSVRLEAETAGVSCERIKELFLLELGMKDDWRGRIELIINSSLPEERGPLLTAIYRPDGWSYELELPKTIQPRIFVRAVLQALLTELANRRAGSQSAEIPFWLVEGFGAHLQAYNLPTFIIRPNVQSAGYRDARIEGMDGIRAGLRQHAPLTFQQLSWPERSNVAGKDEAVYRSCAQLLLESLLHLDDGQSCLRRMLQEMPHYLNWQTAFLLAFHSHFTRLLDVEKWWGLNCVSFTSSDLTEPWTEQECWHKFQDALDVPVEVHLDPARRPAAARLTLQEVIMQWNAADALPALQRAVRDLEGLQFFTFRGDLNLDASAASPALQHNAREVEALQWSIGRELSPLVARYVIVLLNYVKHSQDNVPFASERRLAAPRLLSLKQETVRQLNSLDQERDAIRARSPSACRAAELSALQALEAHGTNSGPAPGPQFRP
jgi:hypothetical protein